MRSTDLGFMLMSLLILALAGSVTPQEDLFINQILDRAYKREAASEAYLKDYICQANSTVREPQKDGTAKTLAIEEKTIYRKFPDKRMEKYNTVTEEGKVLTPEEVAEYQKNQRGQTSMQGGSFFDPKVRANYTYELMSPDTVKGLPSYVLRIKPKKKSKDLIDGKAWLHRDNFEVVKLEFRPAKNPKFVKELNMIINFSEVQPEFWLPTELKIDVRAGFLLIKKHFHMHEIRRDYQINIGLPDSIFAEHE